MGLASRSRRKRWRRIVIGGAAAAVVAIAGYQLSGVGGSDTGVSGSGPDQTSDASRVPSPWNLWGALDATAIQSADGTP